MKYFSGFKIFVADKIHPEGILILEKAGFKIFERYGLSNRDLINFVKKNMKQGRCPGLIIRSVRKLASKEIGELSDTSIEMIATASSGIDHVASEACKRHSISLINVPDGNFVSAAEHTVALLLCILKNVLHADSDTKSGKFDSLKYVNYELKGKSVGIIGVGRVGSHVARLCKAFGAKVFGNDIKKTLSHLYNWIEFKDLEALLKVSDIVTIHTPLDDSTRNLLSSRRLKMLKNNAIILNCARGGIIDESSLIRMLKSGRICYAGIDVFVNEPDMKSDFRKLPNVVLTPHLAGKTVESRKRIAIQLAERIVGYYSSKRD